MWKGLKLESLSSACTVTSSSSEEGMQQEPIGEEMLASSALMLLECISISAHRPPMSEALASMTSRASPHSFDDVVHLARCPGRPIHLIQHSHG